MKAILKNKILKLLAAAIFIITIVSSFFVSFGPTVFAADPGCYVKNQDNNYKMEDNTACQSSSNDPTQNCYIADSVSSQYTQVDCVKISGSIVNGFTYSDSSGSICGSGSSAVHTSIDLGCTGQGNPVLDLSFAIIRLLSDGVGILIIGSLVIAGIQYSASQGDPQATSNAMNRIRTTLLALLIYIFAYAILNYVIPGQLLK